jgi:hypothetical protein
MQVSGSALSAPFQQIENSVMSEFESNQGADFSFLLNMPDSGGASSSDDSASTSASAASSSSAGSTASSSSSGSSSGYQVSGSSQSSMLYAVGTMNPDGSLNMFSPQQIADEKATASKMNQQAFADSLQNFLTLAQAGDSNGQIANASFTDQQSFVGDNGLISGGSQTSFSVSQA